MNKWEELDKEFEDNEEEDVGFGTCEECGCTLYSMPNAGWGVGYVCSVVLESCEVKMNTDKDIEQQELCYCEKYGILEATRKGKLMIYYSSYPLERLTYKIIVDLTNFSELERK